MSKNNSSYGKGIIRAACRWWLCLVVLCCTGVAVTRSQNEMPSKANLPRTFTATREINDLEVAEDGSLWAATNGGVLKYTPDGEWTKWTREQGVPAQEVQRVDVAPEVRVRTAQGDATWHQENWKSAPKGAKKEDGVVWQGWTVRRSLDGLSLQRGAYTKRVELPPCSGSHISALLLHSGQLWTGIFGDAIWQYDGSRWSRVLELPQGAKEITALAQDGKRRIVWIGTRRNGIWRYEEKSRKWTQYSRADEPYNANVQAMCRFHGRLFVSTLEDGLLIYDGQIWQHIDRPTISFVAPRQMVVFGDALYVRHGDGQVDRYDGTTWEKDVWKSLPRHKVFAVTADEKRLIAVQWGGWSEWDGSAWSHHFNVKEFQGAAIVSLCVRGATLWLGTQNRGVIAYKDGLATTYDERQGLPDDWITCLVEVDDVLYAGTFVGGFARFNGSTWESAPKLDGQNVTAIEAGNNGDVIIATRNGLWKRKPNGELHRDAASVCDGEVQALLHEEDSLWIGTRTAIYKEALSDSDSASPKS